MEKSKDISLPKPRHLVSKNPLFSGKLTNFSFQKTHTRFISIPSILKSQEDREVHQFMKKAKFQYQTIFGFEKFYEDEPNTPKAESQKEINETQQVTFSYQKKGFQFFQCSSNNPIQDTIRYFEIPQLNAFAVSIFDGHGGPELSKFCAINTQQYLRKYIRNGLKLHKYENNKIQLIKDGLIELHFELENQFYKQYVRKISGDNKKIKGVGTCAITLVIYDNKCIVANCGDSQAMAISQNSGSYNFQKLSQRFSLSNKAQRLRLVQQFKQIDKHIIVQERRNVFYLKGMLQPTKSIGDYYLKYKQHYIGEDQFKGPYLSCQPDIRVYDIKEHDKHIVIASDGLWDYLNKWEILKYIVESQNQKISIAERETESENQDQLQTKKLQAPQYLSQKILQKVANDFQIDIKYLKSLQLGQRRSYHDDITIAIINLRQFLRTKTVKIDFQ